jgi:hypothetical protein
MIIIKYILFLFYDVLLRTDHKNVNTLNETCTHRQTIGNEMQGIIFCWLRC